jgi:hypothetical protein
MTMLLSLTLVHPLCSLHTAVCGLSVRELFSSDTVGSKVGTDGRNEDFDGLDGVVRFASVTHGIGSAVKGLANSLTERGYELVARVVGIGEDNAGFVRR